MTAVLELDGVREPPFSALRWYADTGMHVVLTGAEEGRDLLVELVTGLRRPSRGRVTVGGKDPSRSPATRRRIASLVAEEQLIDARTVQRALLSEFQLRRASLDPAKVLSDWGLERLQSLNPSELEPVQRRALALATALSLPDPVLVALVEPFADNTGLPRERIRQRLLALAETTCVLCITSVPRDALEIGGSIHLVRSGKLEPVTVPLAEPLAGLFGYLVVACERPRDLVEALAGEPAVAGLEWRDHAGDRVLVWSSNAEQLALAVVKAARSSNSGLRSITPARASLELVRAAQSGWGRAVQERAWWLGRAMPAASSPSTARKETPA